MEVSAGAAEQLLKQPLLMPLILLIQDLHIPRKHVAYTCTILLHLHWPYLQFFVGRDRHKQVLPFTN